MMDRKRLTLNNVIKMFTSLHEFSNSDFAILNQQDCCPVGCKFRLVTLFWIPTVCHRFKVSKARGLGKERRSLECSNARPRTLTYRKFWVTPDVNKCCHGMIKWECITTVSQCIAIISQSYFTRTSISSVGIRTLNHSANLAWKSLHFESEAIHKPIKVNLTLIWQRVERVSTSV